MNWGYMPKITQKLSNIVLIFALQGEKSLVMTFPSYKILDNTCLGTHVILLSCLRNITCEPDFVLRHHVNFSGCQKHETCFCVRTH